MTRRSKHDVSMALMYVRLAYQSASVDPDKAKRVVDDISAQTQLQRERVRLLALALAALMTTPAQAKCHHYSIWKYPWPQQVCAATGKAAVVSLRGRGAAAADTSWYVEITRPPIDNDDEARAAGIDALKQKLGQ